MKLAIVHFFFLVGVVTTTIAQNNPSDVIFSYEDTINTINSDNNMSMDNSINMDLNNDGDSLNLGQYGMQSEDLLNSTAATKRIYFIEFTLTDTIFSDTSGFVAANFEIQEVKSKHILKSGRLTYQELQNNDWITNWDVKIPLDDLPPVEQGPIKLSLVIEYPNKVYSKNFKKTINP